MFHTGDKLAHPGHGGCIISDICTQTRGGTATRYLILIPQNDPGIKIMVPVENAEKVGLREIISAETADRLLDSFSHDDHTAVYENDFAKRRKDYQEILRTGTLQSLVSLIQELMSQPKLNNGDKEMLPKAQKKLFSEIALAKGIEFQRVLEIALARMQPANNMI